MNRDSKDVDATIIVATDENWLIGNRPDPLLPGDLPWPRLPIDMEYFMDTTMGHEVAMTIPTFMSIPEKYRPLKGRGNRIMDRTGKFEYPGTTTHQGFDDLFELYGDRKIYIAGGGKFFGEAIVRPEIKRILRTLVGGKFDGNVYFPELHAPEWKLVSFDHHEADGKNKFSCNFEQYDWGILSRDDIEVVPYPDRIVDPRNARTRAYLLELLMLQRLGKCPFCKGGKTLLEDPIEDQNELCWLKVSHTPVKGAEYHLVIAPMRHVASREELTSDERNAMDSMLYKYIRGNGLMIGGGHFTREGITEVTGATVCHLHENYYINKVVDESPEPVTVNCGIWNGEPGWLNS